MDASVALLAGLSNTGLSARMPVAQLPYARHTRRARLRPITFGRELTFLPQV